MSALQTSERSHLNQIKKNYYKDTVTSKYYGERDLSYSQLILQKLREKARDGSCIPKALLQHTHGDGGSYILIRRTPSKVHIEQVESFEGTLSLIDSIECASQPWLNEILWTT